MQGRAKNLSAALSTVNSAERVAKAGSDPAAASRGLWEKFHESEIEFGVPGRIMAVGLLAGLPARALGGGDAALVYSGTALLLCLAPMALTLAWADRALAGPPEQQLLLVLGGTGLRLALVLGAGGALFVWAPYYQ